MTRGVWIMAAWLVARHGAAAPQEVHARILAMRRALADEQQIASWLMIDGAVHELVRAEPRDSETVH
jgi:protein-tyrosine phosphatase